jgi:hypothetical protein
MPQKLDYARPDAIPPEPRGEPHPMATGLALLVILLLAAAFIGIVVSALSN